MNEDGNEIRNFGQKFRHLCGKKRPRNRVNDTFKLMCTVCG